MRFIRHLNWHDPKRCPGGGTVYRNGIATDLAATRIVTVLGWGVCVHDATDFHGRYIVTRKGRAAREWSFGFFRFVPGDNSWANAEVDRRYFHRRMKWTIFGRRVVKFIP